MSLFWFFLLDLVPSGFGVTSGPRAAYPYLGTGEGLLVLEAGMSFLESPVILRGDQGGLSHQDL